MREIKFRAWDTKYKKMFSVHKLEFREVNGNTGEITHISGTSSVGCTMMEGNNYFGGYNVKRLELMQFTGLRDQNGKEIYEGDICRDEDGLGVVYWEKDCWMYGFVLFDSSYKSDGYMLREMTNDCEIIGNIYENHELLEVAP